MWENPFKRSNRQNATELPPSVEALIEGMNVVIREDDSEGNSRVLLSLLGDAGMTAWHHSVPETRRRLASAFPGLTEAQLERAECAVSALVRRSLDAQGYTPVRGHKRGEWASWQPHRKSIF